MECNDGSDELEELCKNIGLCGGNFTYPNGFLTSPSYPESYPKLLDCAYIISQPTGTAIMLNFLNINIENEKVFCGNCDYIEIRDGTSENAPLLDKLSGNEIPASIQSSQNQLWIK